MILLRKAAVWTAVTGAALLMGCATTDHVTLTTSPRLNTCEGADPHPVVVRIYYLKSADKFSRAEFAALWENDFNTLGEDRISVVEKTLNPKQQLTVSLARSDAAKGATAIGIVANFCKAGEGCWRRAIPITKGDAKVRVHLDEGCLSID
ncbi:MAG: type VI secretion system lipoprotein TssJ [bacterium]